MVEQRPTGAAPAVRAMAEALPVGDDGTDAVMALLTVHLWATLEKGLAELRRVARRRIVIMTWDPEITAQFWLLREYLPEAAGRASNRSRSLMTAPTASPAPTGGGLGLTLSRSCEPGCRSLPSQAKTSFARA
jgi:hypothetical protein